jgi:hypothetical protein
MGYGGLHSTFLSALQAPSITGSPQQQRSHPAGCFLAMLLLVGGALPSFMTAAARPMSPQHMEPLSQDLMPGKFLLHSADATWAGATEGTVTAPATSGTAASTAPAPGHSQGRTLASNADDLAYDVSVSSPVRNPAPPLPFPAPTTAPSPTPAPSHATSSPIPPSGSTLSPPAPRRSPPPAPRPVPTGGSTGSNPHQQHPPCAGSGSTSVGSRPPSPPTQSAGRRLYDSDLTYTIDMSVHDSSRSSSNSSTGTGNATASSPNPPGRSSCGVPPSGLDAYTGQALVSCRCVPWHLHHCHLTMLERSQCHFSPPWVTCHVVLCS